MNILVCRFLRGGYERGEIGSWLADAKYWAMQQGIRSGREWQFADLILDKAPTDVARNDAIHTAMEMKSDVIFMIDHDMLPAKGFFEFACKYITKNPADVIASPYCRADEAKSVNVTRSTTKGLPWEEPGIGVTRESAAILRGLESVYEIGTGLMAIGVKTFELLKMPYFEYGYANAIHSHADSEDYVFCRKLIHAGGTIKCAWDFWSGHHKSCILGKPE